MNQINLLPKWVQDYKARRALLKTLGVLQIAVLLLLVATFYLLTMWENHSRTRYEELQHSLSTFSDAPAQAAEAVQFARTQTIYIQEILANISYFNQAEILKSIRDATPQGVLLSYITFEHGELTITSHTLAIENAEQHRLNLLHYFSYVHMGKISRTYGGYVYEIHMSSSGG